ncbi:unnamed protein product [Sphagnum tenellum]
MAAGLEANQIGMRPFMKLTSKVLDMDTLLALYVSIDFNDSSQRVLSLDQPNLGLSREYLVKGFDDDSVQEYFTYMKETVSLLSGDVVTANLELKESLMFEIALAKVSTPKEERRNMSKLYNAYTVGSLESLAGHPPSWKDYVEQVLGMPNR